MSAALEAALKFVDHGWPVFPCGGNKQPLVAGGFKSASTDVNRVNAWWSEHKDAMIGVPTGALTGVWVLDVDVKGGDGHAELAKLEAENGALPDTITVDTPSGGKHYLFNFVEGVKNRGHVAPNIDVRGEGGYVIVPGSVNDDGQFYEWATRTHAPADAPAWLLALVVRKDKAGAAAVASMEARTPNMRYVEAAIADELSGLVRTMRGRNNALNDSSFNLGQFVGAGVITHAEAFDRLYAAATANGYVAKDGPEAARKTIDSGLESGSAKPRKVPDEEPDDGELHRIGSQIAENFTARAAEKAKAEPGAVTAPEPVRLHATPYIAKDPTTIPLLGWIYGNHYVRRYLTMTVAAGGSGKSLLALIEALSMAAGVPLLGMGDEERLQTRERHTRVWYFNGEDDRDQMDRRIEAARLHYNLKPEDTDGYIFVDSGREQEIVTMITNNRGTVIATPVMEEVKRVILANKIDVMIIDPFVSTHEVNENDNGAIDKVAKLWAKIAEECNCSIEIIHHTKKVEEGRNVTAADSRGGSALTSAARSVRQINHMTQKQADAAGLTPEERNATKAIEFGKVNLGALPAQTRWRRIVDVKLGNSKGNLQQGDRVGVMTGFVWDEEEAEKPEVVLAELDKEQIDAIVERLDGGSYTAGARGTVPQDWAGHVIAEVMEMDNDKAADRARVRRYIEALKGGKRIKVATMKHLGNKQEKQHLVPIGYKIPVERTPKKKPKSK